MKREVHMERWSPQINVNIRLHRQGSGGTKRFLGNHSWRTSCQHLACLNAQLMLGFSGPLGCRNSRGGRWYFILSDVTEDRKEGESWGVAGMNIHTDLDLRSKLGSDTQVRDCVCCHCPNVAGEGR